MPNSLIPSSKKARLLLLNLFLFWINPVYVFSQITTQSNSFQVDQKITSSVMEWLIYEQQNISWSSNFIPVDAEYNIISKDSFFQKLLSGEFYLINIGTRSDSNLYQIRKSKIAINKDVAYAIVSKARREYHYFKMVGTVLPNLLFEDINGNKYDSTNTFGKIIVINCWYLACKPCVEEIPDLNKLVANYKKNADILFIALTFDKKSEIAGFLKTRRFNYAIIPNKKEYLMEELKIPGYPTHIIIDRKNKIAKISNVSIDILKGIIDDTFKL